MVWNYALGWKINTKHHAEIIKSVWSFAFTLLQAPGLAGNEIQLLRDTLGSQLIFRGHLSKLNKSRVECGSLHDRPDCFSYKGQSQLYTAFKIFATLKYINQASRTQESGGLALPFRRFCVWQPIRFVCGHLCQHSASFTSTKKQIWKCEKVSPPKTNAVKVHISL